MISTEFLSLMARLRWRDIESQSPEQLNELHEQLWQKVRRCLPENAERTQWLDAAADLVLFTAFLEEREPSAAHYRGMLQSLNTYGLFEQRAEAAAYVKVVALTRNQDVREALNRIIETIPDLPRRRVGRPTPDNQMELVPTVKKHLDLYAGVVAEVQSQSSNFTAAINDAMMLWLVCGQ